VRLLCEFSEDQVYENVISIRLDLTFLFVHVLYLESYYFPDTQGLCYIQLCDDKLIMSATL